MGRRVLSLLWGLLVAMPCMASVPGGAGDASAWRPDGTAWRSMMQRLGSSNFAERETAQKEVAAIGWRGLAFLKREAEGARDPEIKLRLQAGVAAIEEDIALNPPPVSVDFKSASLEAVANRLSALTRVPISCSTFDGAQDKPLTFQASEQPFWKMFLGLSRAAGPGQALLFPDQWEAVSLWEVPERQGWRKAVVLGPLAIIPWSISHDKVGQLAGANGVATSKETMNFSCTFVLDPRVHVVNYVTPWFTEIVDDAGNTLYTGRAGEWSNAHRPEGPGNSLWEKSLTMPLKVPEKRGTRITSAKGVVRYVAECGHEQVEIANLEQKAGQRFEVAGEAVVFSGLEVKEAADQADAVDIKLTMAYAGSTANAAAGTENGTALDSAMARRYIKASLVDFHGVVVHVSNWVSVESTAVAGFVGGGPGGRFGGGFGPGVPAPLNISGKFTGPFTLRIAVATKFKEVTIPFELKDLPLP